MSRTKDFTIDGHGDVRLWVLEQDDNGTLHVRYVNNEDHSHDYRKPINEFMADGSIAKDRLLELCHRLFQ